MNIQKLLFVVFLVALSSACGAAPSVLPPALPSTSTASVEYPTLEECPSPTPGTLLLKNEADGYCLLYPSEYSVVYPFAGEVCLVSGEPQMACHDANAMLSVESAAGRTVGQIADGLLATIGDHPIQRTTLMIASKEATVIDNYPAVDTQRIVLIVHGEQLYTLTFTPFREDGGQEHRRVEILYTTVVNSLAFLPEK